MHPILGRRASCTLLTILDQFFQPDPSFVRSKKFAAKASSTNVKSDVDSLFEDPI